MRNARFFSILHFEGGPTSHETEAVLAGGVSIFSVVLVIHSINTTPLTANVADPDLDSVSREVTKAIGRRRVSSCGVSAAATLHLCG
jgi:hypothetical protein